MKIWHLAITLGLAIVCGWWLNSQQPAPKSAIRAHLVTRGLHIPMKGLTISGARGPAEDKPEEIIKIPRSIKEYVGELDRLKTCYGRACAYPVSDPRSYELAVGQDLKKVLFQMAEWVRSEGIDAHEVSEKAREFLTSDDGFVQSAALDLISTQRPSADNLDAILANVLAGYDSELIEHAMLELERYESRAEYDKIDQALAQALTTGAPFVAREVSEHLTPFVNERSFLFFQDVVAHLATQSASRINLETCLSDFQRKHTSGG